MSEELAIKIFKQADLEAEVGGCEKCPRQNEKGHTCIGCLDNAKGSLLNYIEQLQQENIVLKELCKNQLREEYLHKKSDTEILTELENWLIENINYDGTLYEREVSISNTIVLEKIKELRGDKNE